MRAALCSLQEILDHLVELMMDPFGNYLIQKLLDRCSEEQRLQVRAGLGARAQGARAAAVREAEGGMPKSLCPTVTYLPAAWLPPGPSPHPPLATRCTCCAGAEAH